MTWMQRFSRLSLLLPLFTGRLAFAAPPRYTVAEVGPVGKDQYAEAVAINNRGMVVGQSDGEVGIIYLWQDGKMTLIQPPGERVGKATAINDDGTVVGLSGSLSAKWWWKSGKVHDFALNPDNTLSPHRFWPTALNNKGLVVGNNWLWQKGRFTDLGRLASEPDRPRSFRSTWAAAVNNRGQVVGASYDADDQRRAFLWENGTMRALEDGGSIESDACDINDAGVVVGQTRSASGTQAVRWRAGQREVLPLPPGCMNGVAVAINGPGQIIGVAGNAGERYGPVLWTSGSVYFLTDLLPVGTNWQIDEVRDINDRGQIVGQGHRTDVFDPRHGILLSPLP